jgi:hypothetical protein
LDTGHGQGDTENRGDAAGEIAALAAIPLGAPASALDAGTQTCAILQAGGLKCWGPNTNGQLGLGDTAHRGDAPGEVAALATIELGE